MLFSPIAKLSLRYPWIATPFLLFCGGCNLFAETTTPMSMEIIGDPDSADRVVVMLPGIRDRGEKFIDAGFVDDARPLIESKHLALIIADAHVGYYRERSVTERLVEDILQRWPDRQFIFAGISIGGFGSLTVARRHPERIESLLLLAPFLGEKPFLERLGNGPPAAQADDDELLQELVPIWAFLMGDTRPPITLGYGLDDNFAPFYSLLESRQADIHFQTIEGDHDWNTWRKLWQRWLGGLP